MTRATTNGDNFKGPSNISSHYFASQNGIKHRPRRALRFAHLRAMSCDGVAHEPKGHEKAQRGQKLPFGPTDSQ